MIEYKKTTTALSSYRYENRLGKIKKLVKSARYPARQVARRMFELSRFKRHKKTKKPGKRFVRLIAKRPVNAPSDLPTTCSIYKVCRKDGYYFDDTMGNRFCQIRKKHILMVHFFAKYKECEYVCGQYIKRTNLQNLFTIPAASSITNEFIANLPNESTPLCCVDIGDITNKYFCMPLENKNHQVALSLLLHKS